MRPTTSKYAGRIEYIPRGNIMEELHNCIKYFSALHYLSAGKTEMTMDVIVECLILVG